MKPYNYAVMAVLALMLFSLGSISYISSYGPSGLAVKGKYVQEKLIASPMAPKYTPIRMECKKANSRICCMQACKDSLNLRLIPRTGSNKKFDDCQYYCYWGLRPVL